jgi:hypothetical protein
MHRERAKAHIEDAYRLHILAVGLFSKERLLVGGLLVVWWSKQHILLYGICFYLFEIVEAYLFPCIQTCLHASSQSDVYLLA